MRNGLGGQLRLAGPEMGRDGVSTSSWGREQAEGREQAHRVLGRWEEEL